MYSELATFLKPHQILRKELMSRHTTFAIGGPVDALLIPSNVEELKRILLFCSEKSVPYIALGNGSNLLVRDKGIRGIAIKLNELAEIEIHNHEIQAQAGVCLRKLAYYAAENSLSGLEFAEGIPGSLGGAVIMNAGAYGGEMKNVLLDCSFLDIDGQIKNYSAEKTQFGYRTSIFQDSKVIIISARLSLKYGQRDEILKYMNDLHERRRNQQPLDDPSAGSVFRQPGKYSAGQLIDKLGLKGHAIGGAEVSTKHAGFIINRGNSTAQDVLNLINYIKKRVYAEENVDLQTEIKVVGEE